MIERIDSKKAVELFKYASVTELGVQADQVRRSLHGNKTTFIKNMHLNVTNICVNNCRFCSFKKKSNDKDAYSLKISEAIEQVEKGVKEGIREVHLVNALNPELGLKYYTELISTIKNTYPNLVVKGLTAIEIDFLSKIENLTHEAVVDALINAGVEIFPGGGAEIFSKRVRRLLGTSKAPKEVYLKVHRIIHSRGIKSNATMLYGHYENAEEVVEHLEALRSLQDETGGFSAFIPLRFVSDNTPLKVEERGAQYDLKIIAFSRLFLDNIEHIKAYWVSLSPEVAQVALSFGADDLDGTIYRERIIRSAGAQVKPGMTEQEMKKLIQDAGFVPVERDSHFRAVLKVG
ncbi:MAG: CofH family radical SAM protein [Actinobacteria bacterium]|nr:CofH family radical SAM protein [Actinomycetota bacterium]